VCSKADMSQLNLPHGDIGLDILSSDIPQVFYMRLHKNIVNRDFSVYGGVFI